MSGEEDDPAGDAQCQVRAAIDHLCQELNLDTSSAAEALRDFTALRGTYSLEGETVHWLACALYVACRKSIIPTVGSGLREGNCVSLTRILRSAKLSLIQFFSKMKKWMDMSNLPQEFRERVERLERNFEVSTVIFKKFKPIFLVIFKNPYEEQPKLQRSRKQRRVPCSVKDLFNFCWTLFVYTKGNFSMIGDDLVNSYHLLLCCLDLIFANALRCPHKRDLLNSSFKGLPQDFHSADFRTSEAPPCIIATLCELHDGLLVEAKGIKEHYFKPYISKLYDRKILKGDCLLDLSNFADNNKALNKEYEEFVLTEGDFDERVFLGADAEEEIGTPQKFSTDMPSGKVMTKVHMECYLQQHFEKKRSFAPSTPLTGRRYLREKEPVITPVASATQSVSRLQSIVAGVKNAPSEQLIAIFESCIRNPMETIMNRMKDIGEAFCQNYTRSTDDQPGSHIDFAVNRLKLAEILYYKILETVMVQEIRRLHGKDMSALLEQDIFHRSLLACCLEIVLFAYSSPRTFPWIIEVLHLRPFYFYKVIEVLIRSEEGLSRDMVKHLNSIEEQILESLAWTKDSALWGALQASENKVPTCEEVIFPCNFETGNGGRGLGHLPMMPVSPIVHPRLKEVRTDLGGSLRRDMQPLSPISVHDRYSSPVAGSAKRRLFGDESPKEKPADKNVTEGTRLKIAPMSSFIDENVSVSTEQTILAMATATVTGQKITLHVNLSEESKVDSHGQVPLTAQALISVSPSQPHMTQAQEAYQSAGSKPKKTGSLALFFRKVYHLASVRLRDLCLKQDVSIDLRRRIWTCFEFTLVHCTDLMKDRHLDQLLLCAFYIMAKVSKEERTFQDIMKSYRNQPQANSHVYRSVLLKNVSTEVALDIKQEEMSQEDSPRKMNCLPIRTKTEISKDLEKEERGDLIKFYNTIYVGRVKTFALKYDASSHDNVTSILEYCLPVEIERTFNEGNLNKGNFTPVMADSLNFTSLVNDEDSRELQLGEFPDTCDQEQMGNWSLFPEFTCRNYFLSSPEDGTFLHTSGTVQQDNSLVEAPPLSPFPSIKQPPVSPRRISQQHSVYVSPHKNSACLTPKTALLYKFNGSPSKSLKEINNMIKQGGQRAKKRAISIDSDTESPAKRLCQENDDVLLKRLQDVVSERANR
ncbi:retinoblastoma-like protein 1 isoform X2 [Rhineura floridana]|uniref:retinoblastoma-like protein 1 isoform X2 n=1 Tax=Rhineura floridana TaxID=261503 RepID=UPI002AC881BD|nr:retinoblastoma-like protein 1 isoform X2 [Rhineura floridana]